MKKFVEIDLANDKLVYLTPPHAPMLVSTISPFNNFNLGSFEQFMTCSNNPPRIILSITQNSDTFKNIADGSDFCVGIPTISLINKIYQCGSKLERNESEFEKFGLHPRKATKTKAPRIYECSVNLECVLYKRINVGDHNLIIGDVVHAVMDQMYFADDKTKRRLNLNAPYYASSGQFFKMGEIIKAEKK